MDIATPMSEHNDCTLTATTRKPYVDIDHRELIEYLRYKSKVREYRILRLGNIFTSKASSRLVICVHFACREAGMTGSVNESKSCRSVSANATAVFGSEAASSTLNSSPVSRS